MFQEITTPLVTTTWGHRLAWGVLVVFAALSGYAIWDSVTTWRSDFTIVHAQPTAVSHPVASDETAKRIAAIPDDHLFGGAPEQTAILPITSLQLKLVGVIKAEPEHFSRVIISEEGKPGVVYQVGDTLLSSGVKVHEIAKDGVVLDNGGRLEKLPLQRTPLEFHGMPKSLLNSTNEQKPQEE